MDDLLPLSILRRLLEGDWAEPTGELCQRCGVPLSAEHRHAANTETRQLQCMCAACHATMMLDAGGDDAHRAVPRRYLRLAPHAISDEQWDAFDIPVAIAFFFHNSRLGRTVTAYPSPAGATESLLAPGAWDPVLRSSAGVPALAPDVEALLVRRTHDVRECFVVPIDACYELAGRMRRRWTGFGGGPHVRAEIDEFFDMLDRKSEPMPETS